MVRFEFFTVSGCMSIKQRPSQYKEYSGLQRENPEPAKDPTSFKNMQNNGSIHKLKQPKRELYPFFKKDREWKSRRNILMRTSVSGKVIFSNLS